MSYAMQSLSIALALFILLCSTQSLAADPRISSTSKSEPSHTLSPAESRAVSLAAGRVLRHAYLARQAIAEKDGEAAAQEVEQGLKLVQIIETTQPTYTVTAEIKAGDLTYSANETVVPPLVPIYDEVGEVELLGPLSAAKREQQSGDEDVVEDVGVEHTSLALNLAFAKVGLTKAKEALGENDLERASAALALVQRSVIFETDFLDVPLATTRENLFLAKTRVARGDSKGAQQALDAADQSLDAYSRLTGETRSKEVDQLRAEVTKLSEDLASGDTTTSREVEQKILSWWDRVVRWWEE